MSKYLTYLKQIMKYKKIIFMNILIQRSRKVENTAIFLCEFVWEKNISQS